MPWRKTEALTRITKLKSEVPNFDIQKFEDYLTTYKANQISLASKKLPSSPPLFSLPKGKAIVVDTVQIYVSITNYDDYRLEEGEETEVSHERAMRLLHLYYSAADRVIENSAAQRVDFHSGRIHAVVLEHGRNGVTQETIAEALAFIEDLKYVVNAANRELAQSKFNMSLRIGVDIGTCVAINNGTGCEQEPMFLGSAANHAAKLASGDHAGVFISERVHQILSLENVVSNGVARLDESDLSIKSARKNASGQLVFGAQNRQPFVQKIIKGWHDEIKRGELPDFTVPAFHFTAKEPPLSKIDYSELQPSKSIRMPLVSLFADLSGYTSYIDNAVASGNIKEAVQALYVIRQEFQNVVEKDFGGRKVRFIGDCIHAVIAEGSRFETDTRESISSAAQCSGGLISSFELCKSELGNLDSLGLAIGLEIGYTPISRIGIRGDRSVRTASSITTTCSEQMQSECEDTGIKFGPNARKNAPAALEDLMDEDGYCDSMDYDEISVCLSAAPEIIANPIYVRVNVPKYETKPRAHLILE